MLKIVMPMNFFGYIMCANLISENDAVKNQLLSSVYCNRSITSRLVLDSSALLSPVSDIIAVNGFTL